MSRRPPDFDGLILGGLLPEGPADGPLPAPWARLARSALDRDLLDAVDLTLIRTVIRRAGLAGDQAIQVVLGCLLASVKGGALRIPSAPEALAARLETFLRALHYVPAPDSPEVRERGFAQATFDPAAAAAAFSAAFHAAWRAGAYREVLGEPSIEEGAPFTPMLSSGGGLYFQRHQAAEARAGMRMAELLKAPDLPLPAEAARGILDTVLRRFPLRTGAGAASAPMTFRDGQMLALALALRKRFAVISGGPGTGKTSLVANLLRAKARIPREAGRPLRIRLAAPTGRAAQRVTESLRRSLAGIIHSGEGSAEEEALDRGLAGLTGETLHRLLRYHPDSGEYFHRKDRPIPADLVVVDEVSMVDIFALARLVDALEDEACLVLLGDMDQLPSVEAGAVLADLVPGPEAYAFSAAEAARMAELLPGEPLALPPGAGPAPLRDHLVVLDRSHRSEAGILDAARRINAMDGLGALLSMDATVGPGEAAVHPLEGPWPISYLEAGRRDTPGGGCRMLESAEHAGHAGPAGLAAWIESWIGFHYLGHPQAADAHPGRTLAAPRSASYAALLEKLGAAPADAPGTPAWNALLEEAFAYLDQARILTFTRKGWHGSSAVNARIREKLAPLWDPRAATVGPGANGASQAFHGAPVLIQENEYSKDLFNGEVGLMLRHRGRSMAWFRKEEGYRSYPAPFLPRHELAFASTVHKAQGSEYDQVLIILPEAGNRLLYKETLYTAITRARQFAGIYGAREVFLEAVARKVVRESGLREYLSSISTP